MKHSLDVAWNGQMKFEADLDGHHLIVDAAPEVGGENAGPRPKKLLLLSLASCTGMDVVSLLEKMRVEVEDFKMTVQGELTEEHPKHYVSMHLIYQFKGRDLPMDKLQKIVEMSQDRYCGVAATFKQGIDVTWEIVVNEA